ncbi:integrase [Nitrosopumilus sp. b3]|uniref:site-specific integrase n=1 Tax=Nitrosopumilus sp. b3 TaxID=2109909 RepID=UPI0015F41151|nr:site-specific integrase [Nitrosopumilus sp. b3]KAF6246232.1 integrase [Nitrosopumilus sp. b3]
MEIHPDEITKSKNNPLELFYSSMRAEATRVDYDRKLRKVLCEFFKPILKGDPELVKRTESEYQTKKRGVKRKFSDADFEVRAAEFVKRAKEDTDWAENVLMKLGEKFKERANLPKTDPNYINPVSLKNYFVPVQKLLEMNRVNLAWKMIRSTFPEIDGKDDTREYTYDEIRKMLNHCKVMDKVLVLLAASSGIRAGAFTFQWKHVIPIYLHNERYVWEEQDVTESVTQNAPIVAAMIRIYANSNSEYIAFTTPECWNAIQGYRQQWIQEIRHEPKPDDPFFKKSGPFVRVLSEMGLRKRLERILKESGIRPPLPTGVRRHKVPAFNGFRRFFNKANKKSLSNNSLLASLIFKETMMGHGGLIQLDKNYFKSHIYELIEEYVDAVPNLTISTELRLQAENNKLSEEKSELEEKLEVDNKQLREDNADIREKFQEFKKETSVIIDWIQKQKDDKE